MHFIDQSTGPKKKKKSSSNTHYPASSAHYASNIEHPKRVGHHFELVADSSPASFVCHNNLCVVSSCTKCHVTG